MQDSKCLYEQFDDVSSCMDSQTMASTTLDAYIRDKSAFIVVFIDEFRRKNYVTSCFQTNLDSVYSIMMILSVLGDIVENTSCQRAFYIVIWPITQIDGMGCHRIHITIISCHHHHTDGTLNSGRYASIEFSTVCLSSLYWSLRNATF